MWSRLLGLFRRDNHIQAETKPRQNEAGLLSFWRKGQKKWSRGRLKFAQKASCQPSSTPEEEERMNSLEKLRIALHKMQKERDELQRILSSYPRNDLNYSLRSCLLLRESLQLKLKAKRARNENRALLLEQIALEESIKETTRFCAEACLQFSIRSLNSAQTRTTSLCDRTVHQEH
ncbi:uncharacterized protein LOC134482089 isoform X2 [Rattus norvegicus]|uniref:uncharacterized protein LOC134482089 isoform X2 n=1 Tax=Rattus norvegicus TaxID=10116 RepID=UPI002FD83B8F